MSEEAPSRRRHPPPRSRKSAQSCAYRAAVYGDTPDLERDTPNAHPRYAAFRNCGRLTWRSLMSGGTLRPFETTSSSVPVRFVCTE